MGKDEWRELPQKASVHKILGPDVYHQELASIWTYSDQPAEVNWNGGLVMFSKGISPQIPLI